MLDGSAVLKALWSLCYHGVPRGACYV